jgi:5-methyltetrahydrofolate--homocysteine methyltransferase
MLLSARAMKASMEILRPMLAAAGNEPVGRVVIGTVKGDLHDIGKNLVSSMLEGGGFEVIDLGADVSPQRFIDAVTTSNANLVALSALLTVTMTAMKTTIEAFQAAGMREKVKIMIGGAPVTQQYADLIGADGYGESASGAVALARKLVAA